ncbi:hypothetical protein DUI87_19424 [Hirundo rustica rustica]|uniref:RNA-directed DNA polymerase n=1 Tax=Hirundo rustica rustica TaxID=333673 RepID=A0A3M0KA98_HIRRU|nr:hypothetical protein DUI87_19424 [Hirundo rustica rustica]
MMSPPGQAAALAGTRLPSNQVPQGTGVPAPSNPEVPEQGAETAASSCSIPTLAPVTFRNARGGNNRAEYHPFPRATIKEICKAHRIYGRDGPYFRGLLRADLSAEEVVPADLKYLFSCLLNSTEYILWVTAWKRLLQEALPGLLNHVNTRVDAQGNPLTLDHLAGEGQWAEATDQVVIPVQCLHVVRETALTAFFSMQTQGPAISYSKIRQDQIYPYTPNQPYQTCFRLQLTEGLHLKDDNWNFVSVDNSEQGTWPRVKGKLIVVGDCKHTPKEIEILPGTLDNNPGKFVLWLRCTHPPTFLPKGQTVAQIIPTWEHLEEDNIPTACPVHNITEVKPQVGWFELQEDKVQRMPPWRYLGLEIGKRTIVPQKLEIKAKIQTLADVHQLCGALNWELVAELIRKARVRIRELAGCDFECIHIPIGLRSGQITKAMLEHLLQENEALQFALDSFTGQISIHRPAHKIFNQDAKFTLNLKDVRSRKPLEALTVFTDASGKSHKSVMTWKDPQTQQWEADVAEVEGSPQVAELAAVVRAFERFPEPFNLVTDSAYVAGVVSRADQAILQEVSNTALFELLSKLVKLVSHREQPFFVMHTRSHTDLPGFIAEGNRRADALAAPAAMAPLPSIFEQAKLSHQLHHQNAPGLVRRFHITREQAKAIVATCPSCNQHALPTLSAGVNPRGLNSCELWQTDVTHIPQFGRSKYVHVSVDTFSGAVFASAHAGEKTLDAIKHLIQAFSFMGIPKELKTDNGPAYRSKEFCSFLQQWGVGHKTGIPHSSTGQAVVERTHREIKRVLNQQQPVLKTETPQTRLARALFTLNFLNSTFEFLNPPIVRHFGANPQLNIKERPPVMVRDPETGRTEGPHDLVTWGRGYACVSTPTGPRWLPSKWVRPYVPKVSGEKKKLPQVTQAAFRRKRREDFSPDGFAFLNDPCSNADCLF